MTIALESCDDSHLLRRCCSPEAGAERTCRPTIAPHSGVQREQARAELATWESRAGRTELSDQSPPEQGQEEEEHSSELCWSVPADHTSARERWAGTEQWTIAGTEQCRAGRKVSSATMRSPRRTRMVTRSSRPCRTVQRRARVAELWKKQPLHGQSAEGRDGGAGVSQTTSSMRVSVRKRICGSACGQARVSSRQATHCEVGVSSALAERD